MNAATIASILAAAAPLIYATVGETITEKVGVINLSLEGSILLSALTAFATAFVTGSVTLGFLAAGAVSALIAVIIAMTSIELRLNQIAVGFVATLLAAELSTFLGRSYTRRPGPSVPAWDIPVLVDIPFVGRAFFSHNLSVYGAALLVVVATLFLFRTRAGLELQAAGERPEAAFARGIPVNRLRYLYTALGGMLVGFGGAAFSLDVKLGWSEGHTTNFGWIALAIVIFGGWHPVRAAIGCVLFGALQIAALKAQSSVPDLSQILPILPFPLMILTLVLVNRPWFRGLGDRRPGLARLLNSEAPSGLGQPFWRE